MSDFDDDTLLHRAFATFRGESIAEIRAAGTGAIRADVRHRRKVRAITLSALAVVIALAPVAAYAIGNNRHVPPNVAVTPSADSTPSPSPTPSPTGAPTPTQRASNGAAITAAELGNATLNIPEGMCLSGPVKLDHGRKAVRDFTLSLKAVVSTGRHTVAHLSCTGRVTSDQVVAFERDQASGIRTVGRVSGTGGQIKTVFGIAAGESDEIRVQLGDFRSRQTGGVNDGAISQRQWRSYGWNGERYVQTAGPTSFPPNPRLADLSLTTGGIVFGAAVGGMRTATLTVTIRNRGPSPVRVPYGVTVHLSGYLDVVAPNGCILERRALESIVSCERDSIAVGETRQVQIEVRAPDQADESWGLPDFPPRALLFARGGESDPSYVAGTEVRYADPSLGNEQQPIKIRFP